MGDPVPAGDPSTLDGQAEGRNLWQERRDALDRTRVTARDVEAKRDALELAIRDAVRDQEAHAAAHLLIRVGYAHEAMTGPVRKAFVDLLTARAVDKAARDHLNSLG